MPEAPWVRAAWSPLQLPPSLIAWSLRLLYYYVLEYLMIKVVKRTESRYHKAKASEKQVQNL